MVLAEEEIVRNKNNNEVSLFERVWTSDGLMWYLIPGEIKEWPNGNPHRVLYENLVGNRLVVWLNEVGGLIYNRVYA